MYETDCILFCHKESDDWVNNWHLYLQIFLILSLHQPPNTFITNLISPVPGAGSHSPYACTFQEIQTSPPCLNTSSYQVETETGILWISATASEIQELWPELKGKMMDVLSSVGEPGWCGYIHVPHKTARFLAPGLKNQAIKGRAWSRASDNFGRRWSLWVSARHWSYC